MNFLQHTLTLFALLLLSGCYSHYDLVMMVPIEDEPAMREIVDDINSHSHFEIQLITRDSVTEVMAIDQLLNREFDITPVDNTLDYHGSKKNIKTVLPFFHEVLVLLSKERRTQAEVDSLIHAGDYTILSKEIDELDFYKRLIPNFTGDSTLNYRLENHFDLKADLEEASLVMFFSARENLELGRLLFDGEAYIHSLDHVEDMGRGSFIEGFCRDYKKTTPYMLSRYAFGISLEKPIFTMAVHELLVAHSETQAKVIYDLIQTIHHHHIVPIFESSNNHTFEVNHQDINLSFPFHRGTTDYLNRDEPSFVERYADVMGFILSAFILLAGLIASLRAHIHQRKKDRMDEYYRDLLHLKENFDSIENVELRRKLTDMQKVVFDLLIREKLSANNEFVIFMMLWDELHQELLDDGSVNDE